MDKTKKEQAEKLRIRLDRLLQTRDKKQAAFDKAKKEIADLSKNIDSTKLKLFEILQSGSDDAAFSSWAKRKISENGNAENSKTTNIQNGKPSNRENANFDNFANPNSVSTTKTEIQKSQTEQRCTEQIQQPDTTQTKSLHSPHDQRQ
jgi:hypothetical protein